MNKINLPLLALAVGAFAIGTTEFSPMGFLPEIAESLNISIATAGMLISAYALGVMLAAPFMTLLFGHLPRRKTLVILMAIFTIGNLLAAIAPSYWGLMGARIITSLNHGAFFGIGSVVATSVVPKEQQTSAVAAMFMGLTLANIGGVPLATWVGQNIGWRTSFMAIVLLGVITMSALYKAIPADLVGQRPDVKAELKVLIRPAVLTALLTTVFSAGAMFSLYTYIAPSLQNLTHATPMFITSMLIIIGIGFSVGNHLGGKLADRSLYKTLIGFLILLIVVMLVFPILATTTVGASIALFVWGVAAFAIVPPIQICVMSVAHEAPGLAASVNIGAFNLGNALGAAAGSAVLSVGMGYAEISIVGAILAAFGLVLVYYQAKTTQRSNAVFES
ncbi:MFS transporter [Acinetobacter rudis]|uniref:MFS transporter, DHA1 family, arabinose polymer transporter n=1 Tax=Acinetobacter rudis CIP 110305 TaxID=421052 RepID=S3PMF2_9GAMM|nr:MFS transporter [Acinetobacter rudis]EPF79991.1 MFS transporter, DHA1 family, arabinose polymer transporter [Acinetobacter rudis CIP 110305]